MRRLCAVLLVAAAVSVASADIIYDTITGATTWSTTGGLPRNRMADSFSTAAPPANQVWEVEQVETVVYIAAAGTYNISFDILCWDEWNGGGFGGAGTNVFRTLLNQTTFNLAPITTTGVAVYSLTLDYSNIALQIADPLDLGFEVQWYNNGVKDNNVASALRDAAPSVGASTNLFYRDANDNGAIETTDGRTITGWTNVNLGVRITATAVPEPVSLVLLALAGLALRRR